MLLFSLFIAGSSSFGKLIANDISPGALTAARFFLGASILLVILVIWGKFKIQHFRQPLRYVPLVVSYASFFVLMFYALKTTSAVSTGVLFILMPFISAILSWMLFKKSSPVMVWLALGFGASGALWIVLGGSIDHFLQFRLNYGDIVFLIGLFAYSFYSVLVPKLTKGEPVYSVTFAVMAGGAVLLVILFLQDIRTTNWSNLPTRVWVVLFYLSIFSGICSMWLMTFASHRLAPTKVTAYTYLTPFWVLIIEQLLGRGWPNGVILLGILPIILGLGFLMVLSD